MTFSAHFSFIFCSLRMILNIIDYISHLFLIRYILSWTIFRVLSRFWSYTIFMITHIAVFQQKNDPRCFRRRNIFLEYLKTHFKQCVEKFSSDYVTPLTSIIFPLTPPIHQNVLWDIITSFSLYLLEPQE